MKQLPIALFILVALVQWFFPLQLVLQGERILKEGKVYKFKTVPVDPNDPFRGKYMVLGFEASEFRDYDGEQWQSNETAYASLRTNQKGFAEIYDLDREAPFDDEVDFLKVTIRNSYDNNNIRMVFLDFPFERFYLEESKAPKVEDLFRKLSTQKNKNVYALVHIKQGQSVLKDVMVDDIPIVDLVD